MRASVILLIALSGCGRPAAPTAALPNDPVTEVTTPTNDTPVAVAVTVGVPLVAESDPGSFRYPEGQAGSMLKAVLSPGSAPIPSPEARTTALVRPTPAVERPQAPIPSVDVNPVTLPNPPLAVTQPRALRIVAQPATDSRTPPLPSKPSFPVRELVRVDSPDVHEPPPLPLLSTRPSPDRAPLDDPSGEQSSQAILSASTPQLSGPAPFVRINLPEPIQFRRGLMARPTDSTSDFPMFPRKRKDAE